MTSPIAFLFGGLPNIVILSSHLMLNNLKSDTFTYLFITYSVTYLLTYLHIYLITSLLAYLLTHSLTYLLSFTDSLIPWSRVLLEKLTNFQLVKTFPAIFGTRRFITVFTIACHLSLS